MSSNDQDPDILAKRFRAYCWRVIDNAANDAYNFLNKGADVRIPFSILPEDLPAPEKYTLPIAAQYYVAGQTIPVFDYDLADALEHLSHLQREIIFRYFYLRQTDAEIAAVLKHSRRTICNYKIKALKQMRKWMEET